MRFSAPLYPTSAKCKTGVSERLPTAHVKGFLRPPQIARWSRATFPELLSAKPARGKKGFPRGFRERIRGVSKGFRRFPGVSGCFVQNLERTHVWGNTHFPILRKFKKPGDLISYILLEAKSQKGQGSPQSLQQPRAVENGAEARCHTLTVPFLEFYTAVVGTATTTATAAAVATATATAQRPGRGRLRRTTALARRAASERGRERVSEEGS